MTKGKKIAFGLVLGIPLFCCLGGVALFMSTIGGSGDFLKREQAEARKIGMPYKIGDLQRESVPDDQNAAELYGKLGSLLDGELKKPASLISKGFGKKAKPEDVEAAKGALSDLEPAFTLLEQLPKHPQCDFHRDLTKGMALLFPEFAQMKGCAKILTFRAQVLGERGDWKGALKNLDLAERVGKDAGSDPIMIGMLVQVACEAIAGREIENLTDKFSHNPEALNGIEKLVNRWNILPNMKGAFGGEIVLGQETFKTFKSGKDLGIAPDSSDSPDSSESRRVNAMMSVPGFRDYFRAKHLSAWRIGWSKFPKDPNDWQGYGKALKGMSAAVEADHSLGNILNEIMMPVFDQACDAPGRIQARNRMLLTAIELLRLRNAEKRLPAHLPTNMGLKEIDPFDGNPLRYRRQGSGFIIYSIGADRVDDGGHARDPGDSSNKGVDEVLTLH